MNKEQRELLLKELCARLPYGIKVKAKNGFATIDCINIDNGIIFAYRHHKDWCESLAINSGALKDHLPYLRPMSSMTDDESNELDDISDGTMGVEEKYISVCSSRYWDDSFENILSGINWLREHHFDFSGLIERGLAIDCTDLNIY